MVASTSPSPSLQRLRVLINDGKGAGLGPWLSIEGGQGGSRDFVHTLTVADWNGDGRPASWRWEGPRLAGTPAAEPRFDQGAQGVVIFLSRATGAGSATTRAPASIRCSATYLLVLDLDGGGHLDSSPRRRARRSTSQLRHRRRELAHEGLPLRRGLVSLAVADSTVTASDLAIGCVTPVPPINSGIDVHLRNGQWGACRCGASRDLPVCGQRRRAISSDGAPDVVALTGDGRLVFGAGHGTFAAETTEWPGPPGCRGYDVDPRSRRRPGHRPVMSFAEPRAARISSPGQGGGVPQQGDRSLAPCRHRRRAGG